MIQAQQMLALINIIIGEAHILLSVLRIRACVHLSIYPSIHLLPGTDTVVL